MNKFLALITICFVILTSCEEEKSDKNDIIEFNIASSSYATLDAETKIINVPEKSIYIAISNEEIQDIYPLIITPQIKISASAKITPKTGETITINSPDDVIYYNVTSEDGEESTWKVYFVHKQLQNFDLQKWFTVQLTPTFGYSEAGQSASTTIWASANAGTSAYNVYNTIPFVDNSDTMALIRTGSVTSPSIPITAGTLFTGKFNIAGAIANPTDPTKATKFGTPYFWRPEALGFTYKYTPGENYIKATLKNDGNLFGGFNVEQIAGEDSAHIYAILERRTESGTIVVGRTEITSASTNGYFQGVMTSFLYYNNEEPTHISVVMTSSKYGNLWTGAQGSELIIDDIQLLYNVEW